MRIRRIRNRNTRADQRDAEQQPGVQRELLRVTPAFRSSMACFSTHGDSS